METNININPESLSTSPLDHLGIVAATCKELGLAKRIDEIIPNSHPDIKVSIGQAVSAMIINGLGFVNNRLYLVSNFFEDKPVDKLIAPGIEASNLNDYILGKALDKIADFGTTKLFQEIMYPIMKERNLFGKSVHHDTTSISVEGDYKNSEFDSENILRVKYGHSKDHRPDLKQVILELTSSGLSGIPFWMEVQDGNSSDKKTLPNTILKMNEFHKQMKDAPNVIHISDSASYHKNGLLAMEGVDWLSRVPESIKEAKLILEQEDDIINWKKVTVPVADGTQKSDSIYKIAPFESMYADISQRWLLVYSEESFSREKKTFERKLEKLDKKLETTLWHLANKSFKCEQDAHKAAKDISKKWKYHEINVVAIDAVKKYQGKGRPSKSEEAIAVEYKIRTGFNRREENIAKALNRKGRFIVATNIADEFQLSDKEMLIQYKSQSQIERGFRFLKDPWFMVDSIFLKTESRIAALMVIMALCLVVYNFAQFKMRNILKEKNETLPNQLKKEISNPTMRWIFQIMVGIAIVKFKTSSGSYQEVTTNLNPVRTKIIKLFGKEACEIYGFKEYEK